MKKICFQGPWNNFDAVASDCHNVNRTTPGKRDCDSYLFGRKAHPKF